MIVKEKEIFVPWSDAREWETVRNQILSTHPNDVIRGYETMLMWKLKHDALPAHVESTLGILQIKIKQQKWKDFGNFTLSVIEENDVRLACSTALIRFVNHVSSVVMNKGESLYSSAKTQNIPDWIINIRHEAAHSQDLPTIDALFAALDIAFEWLVENYWKKNNQSPIKPIQSQHHSQENKEVRELFDRIFVIWDGLISNKKITLEELKPIHRSQILNFLDYKIAHFEHIKLEKEREMLDFLRCSHQPNDGLPNYIQCMKVGKLKLILLNFIQAMVKVKSYKHHFLSSLLVSSFIQDSTLKVSKWQKMFEIIQNVKLLEDLFRNLFALAGNGEVKASKWLMILHQSVKCLRKKWTMFKVLKKQNKEQSQEQIKKQVQVASKKIQRKPSIALAFSKPPAITLDMVQEALMNPETPHLSGLIEYLKFIKPPLPASTVNLIKNLISAHQTHDDSHGLNEIVRAENKLFTVRDLEEANSRRSAEEVPCTECDNKEWTKTKIDVHSWSKCPLGLLPFQSRVDCELPMGIDWMVEIVQADGTITRKSLNELKKGFNFLYS